MIGILRRLALCRKSRVCAAKAGQSVGREATPASGAGELQEESGADAGAGCSGNDAGSPRQAGLLERILVGRRQRMNNK